MAAPTFVQAGTGVTVTSANGTATLTQASVVAGDLVILHLFQVGTGGTVTLNTIINIEDMAGSSNVWRKNSEYIDTEVQPTRQFAEFQRTGS